MTNLFVFFAWNGDLCLQEFDAPDQSISFSSQVKQIRLLTITKNNQHFISIGADRTIRLWSISDQTQLAIAILDTEPTHFSHFDKLNRIVLGDEQGNLYCFEYNLLATTMNPVSVNQISAGYYAEQGSEYARSDDYEEAEDLISTAIYLEHDNYQLYSTRADTFLEKGDYKSALADIEKAIALFFKHSASSDSLSLSLLYKKQSHILWEMGRREEAVLSISKAIEIRPSASFYHRDRGVIYAQSDKFTEALADFNMAVKLDPEESSFLIHRARTHFRQSQFDLALVDTGKALHLLEKEEPKKFPIRFAHEIREDQATTYALIAEIRESQKNELAALEAIDQAIHLDKQNYNWYFQKGVVYLTFNRFDLAVAKLKEALGLCKYHYRDEKLSAPIESHLGQAYLSLEMDQEAKDCYDNVLSVASDHVAVLHNAAIVEKNLGNYDYARKLIDKAIAIDPHEPFLQVALARICINTEQFDLALSHFDHALHAAPHTSGIYYHRGHLQKKKGLFEQAVQDFTQAIEYDAQVPVYYLQLGNCLVELDDDTVALDNYTKALDIDSQSIRALLQRSALYFRQQLPQRAISDLRTGLSVFSNPDRRFIQEIQKMMLDQLTLWFQHDPNDQELLRHILPLAESFDDNAFVLTIYQHQVARDPDNLDCLYQLGQKYYTLDQMEEAVALMSKILSLDSSHQAARRLRADIYYALDRYELAIADYTILIDLNLDDDTSALDNDNNALDLDSQFIRTLLQHSALYFRQQMPQQAISDIRISLRVFANPDRRFVQEIEKMMLDQLTLWFQHDPHDQELLKQILPLAESSDDDALVVTVYQHQVAQDPDNIDLLYQLGRKYHKLDQEEEAVAVTSKILSLDSAHQAARNLRADAYYYLDRYESAIADYTTLIDSNEDKGSYYYDRGKSYYWSRNYTQAQQDFTYAIERGYDYNFVLVYRGRANFHLKELDQAEPDLTRAIDNGSSSSTAYYYRGRIYQTMNRFEHALQDIDKAIEIDPEYASAYDTRGDILVELQQYDRAVADYDQALSLNEKMTWIFDARAAVHSLLGDYARAKSDAAAALLHYPNDSRPQSIYVLASFHLDDFTDTLEKTELFLEDQPQNFLLYYLKGKCHIQHGQFAEAIPCFEKTITLQPDLANAYTCLGVLLWSEDEQVARSYLEKGVELEDEAAVHYLASQDS